MKKTAVSIFILLGLCFCGPGSEDFVEKTFGLQELFAIDTEDAAVSDLGIPDIFGFDVGSDGALYILRAYAGEGDFIFRFDPHGGFIDSF